MIDTTVVVVEEIQRTTFETIWYWVYCIASVGKYYWCTGARIEYIRSKAKELREDEYQN